MHESYLAIDILLLCISCGASAWAAYKPSASSTIPITNFTDIGAAMNFRAETVSLPKTRRKRYISQNDMLAILDYHNKVRGKVFPPASNMEYMVSCLFPLANCTAILTLNDEDFFFWVSRHILIITMAYI